MKNEATFRGNRWLRVGANAIALAVLLAVPALALSHFVPGLVGRSGGTGDQVANDLFALDGPTSTMAKSAAGSNGNVRDEILQLSDWSFTESRDDRDHDHDHDHHRHHHPSPFK